MRTLLIVALLATTSAYASTITLCPYITGSSDGVNFAVMNTEFDEVYELSCEDSGSYNRLTDVANYKVYSLNPQECNFVMASIKREFKSKVQVDKNTDISEGKGLTRYTFSVDYENNIAILDSSPGTCDFVYQTPQ